MRTISVFNLSNLNVCPTEVRFAPSDPDGQHEIIYLATDSRDITNPTDTVFAAIRTGVNDGHRYIPELYNKGVRAFIVESLSDELRALDASFIVVESVEETLRRIAYARIRGCEGGIIVTGSYGKTKTKELIYRTLLNHGNTYRSPRSWNSGIGVPLAIWDMTIDNAKPDHIITEVAIDGPGQGIKMQQLLANSHHVGVITPITDEHDEAFDSHADKVREKIDIVRGCNTIVYADTDVELRRQLQELEGVELIPVAVPQPGSACPTIFHALAECVCSLYDVPQEDITTLMMQPAIDMRRRISPASCGNTIIRDLFTPDLRSLADSLKFFCRHTDNKRCKILVVGDLLTKDHSDDSLLGLYTRAIALARRSGIDSIVFTGHDVTTVKTMLPASDDLIFADSALITDIEAGRSWHDSDILVFGEGSVSPYLNALESAAHDTTLEVDLDALVSNYNYYRHLVAPGTGIVAMVKASAYGTGAVEVAKTMQDAGAAYLAVAVIDEGIALRDAGVSMPVMVLNPITNRHRSLFTHRLEPAVFSLGELHTLRGEAAQTGVDDYPIHIKIDTGMHRVGFLESEIDLLAKVLSEQSQLRVASVFTHLATADCIDMDDYTEMQIAHFSAAADRLEKALGYNVKRHFLNTAGMMRFADEARYDMARLGIGLYGISPYNTPDAENLKPVAALRTRIISLKNWPADTPIGYGCKGRTKRNSIIATIPVGYADGINRHLGRGNASFYVKGIPCPTIGNICMDQCMVDVTEVDQPRVGDAVEVFGPSQPVEVLAEKLDTIPYEILTSVSPRVKRTYLKR